jgi:hypothetical protein
MEHNDLTFAEYRLAVQLAKLPKEKVQLILKQAAILKQIPPSKTRE